jgi:hypothetical protein
MFGLNVSPKSVTRTGEGNHKAMTISLSVLAAAVPAVWLGGCLATKRPAWFLSRRTVRKMHYAMGELKDKMEDMKDYMEDMKDKMGDVSHRAKKISSKGWFGSMFS